MATTQTKFPTDSIKQLTKGVTEYNQKALDASRKARASYLDSSEKAVLKCADSYEKVAKTGDIEWVGVVAATQADLTRELTKAYVALARGMDA